MNPRKAAALSLNSCIKNGRFANLELDSVIKKYNFEGLDKSFFTALLYGSVERLITLDYVISKFSDVPLDKIDPVVLCILRISVYQIMYMDRVPDNAVCNEAVEISKRITKVGAANFINAVLRSICRKKDELPSLLVSEGGFKALSVSTGLPEWILKLWKKDYGADCTKALAFHFADLKPYLTLRVNTVKTTRESLLSALGAKASPCKYSEVGIKMDGSFPATDLYGFDDGLFFVQDEASQLTVLSAVKSQSAKDGTLLVDCCACPGGKTFSSAIELHGKGEVYSFDLHENRTTLISSGAKRLGLDNIHVGARDARTPDEALFGKADIVICDIPCSGLGVIGKKPDIRHKTYADIERLPTVQYDILCQAVKYLKVGGTLIYSTCTLRKAENEDIVTRFMEEHGGEGYRLESTGIFGDDCGYVTFFPHLTETDGFFAAKIVKL